MYKEIIGKVKYDGEIRGTCFLINEQLAFTAYHVISNLLGVEDISVDVICDLEMLGEEIEASIVYKDKDLDVAILKLHRLAINEKWHAISISPIEEDDEWESSGYPECNGGELESLKGSVKCLIKKELISYYELQIPEQNSGASWIGLSGAPVVIDNEVAGIVLSEKEGALKTRLYAIDIGDVLKGISEKAPEIRDQMWTGKHYLLKERMIGFEEVCEEVFYNYKEEQEKITASYHILQQGDVSLKMLCQRLVAFVSDYGIKLSEREKESRGRYIEKREQEQKNNKIRNRIINFIQQDDEIIYILLWVILEGYRKMPRVGTRVVDKKSLKARDVFIDENGNLDIVLGLGGIGEECSEIISSSLEDINNLIHEGKVALENEIFMWDLDAASFLPFSVREVFKSYKIDHSQIQGVIVSFAVIIGYNCDGVHEDTNLNKDGDCAIKLERLREALKEKQTTIENITKCYPWIVEMKINYFLVPFDDVNEFKKGIKNYL